MKNKQYLLDTNILIDFMEGVPAVVEDEWFIKLMRKRTNAIILSALTLYISAESLL